MSQKLSEAKGDMKDPEPHLVHSLGSAASVVHEPDLDKPLSERRYRGKAVADWSAQIPQSPLPAPNSYLDDCMVHDFSISHGEIGNGSFGTVTQVSCRECNLVSIKKPNLFPKCSLLIHISTNADRCLQNHSTEIKRG
jgi:hypothetical protein